MKRTVMICVAACFICGVAGAQEQHTVGWAITSDRAATMEMNSQEVGLMFGQSIKGAPFSAQEIEEHAQTLGDGTHINRKSTVTYARDSQGRVRREDAEWITIYDPISGTSYRLNKKTQTGTKVQLLDAQVADYEKQQNEMERTEAQLKEQAERAVAEEKARQDTANATIMVDGKAKTVYSFNRGVQEPLGTQVVNGVMADGTRITNTIPVGDMGNDKPIVTVEEKWYSPELQLTILFKRTDPREGDETREYTNISRTEPNAALFQVPAGYTIRSGKNRNHENQ